MFKSTGLAKMFAGRRKFFRGPHVRHLCFKCIFIFSKTKVLVFLCFVYILFSEVVIYVF